MESILRPLYLNKVVSFLDKEMMLFLIGQRRVGKSFLLRQVGSWIKENKPEANVIYINKEDYAFSIITTAEKLIDYVNVHYRNGVRNYLLIDEVQDIDCYENALRSFHSEDKLQIVATGSNAYVFSTELSTKLSGRYIEIPVYPLGYEEFLGFHGLEDSEDALNKYLMVGGLPALKNFNIQDEGEVRSYLQGVYNTVLLKDVVKRNDIRNIQFVENLAHFVGDNIGKLISPGSIYRFMKGKGEKIAENTVSAYLQNLCSALLTVAVPRYDIHGKRIFESIYKYYFSDHGLRNFICGFNLDGSIEKVMENVVWQHLLIQGFTVGVGILRAGEIDFVAERGSEKIYIQVAYLIATEEIRNREFGNLLKINDNFPKYVISANPMIGGGNNKDGIRHMSLRQFLKTRI